MIYVSVLEHMDLKNVTRMLITELIVLARYTRDKYELKRSFVRNLIHR